MGYVVECIANIVKSGDLSAVQTTQHNIAAYHGANSQYFTYEIDGYKREILRGENIHVAHFDNVSNDPLLNDPLSNDQTFKNVLHFIRDVYVKKQYVIDCIYDEQITTKLLYASPRYLKRLDKLVADDVRKSIASNIDQVSHIRKAMRRTRNLPIVSFYSA